jgi:hypothetical protein
VPRHTTQDHTRTSTTLPTHIIHTPITIIILTLTNIPILTHTTITRRIYTATITVPSDGETFSIIAHLQDQN